MTGSGEVAHRTPLALRARLGLAGKRVRLAPLLPVAVASGLLAAWLIADPRTPDLAAQVYRVNLFGQLGPAVWDAHWYAGHHLPGYSLLFPPLASLLGLRLTAVFSLLVSVALFQRLTLAVWGASARWAPAWFAVAAAGDLWIGRLPFALGVSFAVAAALALVRQRLLWAAALAALCAAASPVAGALLALAGLTHALLSRRWRPLLALAAPAAVVLVPLALLFAEGGSEPYPILSFLATLLVVAAFLAALPREQRELRAGAVIYLLACLLFLLAPTPMGSNIERYGVLLAGPLLLCAFAERREGLLLGRRPATVPGEGILRRIGPGTRPALAGALLAAAVWVAWGPVRETLAVAGNHSTSASYYAPVERFLAARGEPVRVEVPLTRSHWEAALLAPSVSLARGWEKQLDERFDRVLLTPGLSAASYRRWLQQQAVGYVALPDTPLDPASAGEGRLIRAGLPYLQEVFASGHWRIYAVLAPQPLASGPGRLTSLGHDRFTLDASAAGRFLVRVHYSRYLTLIRGSGCVSPGHGGWTSVLARAPGPLVIEARFSLERALGLSGACREGRPA